MPERSFYVLAYDLSDDRRRAKIARWMEELGGRVQGSVFEAYLTETELASLLKKARRLLKPGEDSLRIYSLCPACTQRVRTEGKGERTQPPDLMII